MINSWTIKLVNFTENRSYKIKRTITDNKSKSKLNI